MNPRPDFWHCEACWDKFHNGSVDKDWIDLEEWISSGNAKRMEECTREFRESIGKLDDWALKDGTDISFCHKCYGMTYTLSGRCGKCGCHKT